MYRWLAANVADGMTVRRLGCVSRTRISKRRQGYQTVGPERSIWSSASPGVEEVKYSLLNALRVG